MLPIHIVENSMGGGGRIGLIGWVKKENSLHAKGKRASVFRFAKACSLQKYYLGQHVFKKCILLL